MLSSLDLDPTNGVSQKASGRWTNKPSIGGRPLLFHLPVVCFSFLHQRKRSQSIDNRIIISNPIPRSPASAEESVRCLFSLSPSAMLHIPPLATHPPRESTELTFRRRRSDEKLHSYKSFWSSAELSLFATRLPADHVSGSVTTW